MKSATGTTPPDISTLKMFFNVPKFETPSFMDRLNPENDKQNFNPENIITI